MPERKRKVRESEDGSTKQDNGVANKLEAMVAKKQLVNRTDVRQRGAQTKADSLAEQKVCYILSLSPYAVSLWTNISNVVTNLANIILLHLTFPLKNYFIFYK